MYFESEIIQIISLHPRKRITDWSRAKFSPFLFCFVLFYFVLFFLVERMGGTCKLINDATAE